MKQVHNFNAGPAVLPRAALLQTQQEMLDFRGTGMSIVEISHHLHRLSHAPDLSLLRVFGFKIITGHLTV